jgi:hypothetical protein
MTDKRLDDAIDRTIRGLMSADPRPGLSVRVKARIQQGRTPSVAIPRLAAAAALIASLVIAFLTIERAWREPPASVEVENTRVVNTDRHLQSPRPVADATPVRDAAAPAHRFGGRRSPAVAVGPEPQINAPPPIPQPAALDVRALDDDRVPIAQLDVPPLDLGGLHVDPLSPQR